MRHPVREIGSRKGIGARVLGTYEMELHPIVEEICTREHDLVVHVGAGEGFYVIGLALRKPRTPAKAFEADEEVQGGLVANLALNGVSERVEIKGRCELNDLEPCLAGANSPLLIMDVEGAELTLLDPLAVPSLAKTEILVEIHDFASADIAPAIQGRLRDTHEVTEIWSRERTADDLPPGLMRWLSPVLPTRGVRWMDEGRGGKMRWFHARPKSTVSATDAPQVV